ncbi:MAG: type III pantothenate kinase [Thiotrichales bacterium]|jgi:type III pantothenate kinase|nr:type III pantothenate kinase [Thiotrichales bacterium]MBT3614198.1 type III pantothenate kinase [Thiotrichales bacterium]MBT3752016.1 type III pantothenate kinase [Thiotrichales bacterium]MBT3837399.1 type III pantothenate kinase [Thiotrichales bacterium]MBT4152684.1 type III pantothenate kinase [Thiotrichales bacterium]
MTSLLIDSGNSRIKWRWINCESKSKNDHYIDISDLKLLAKYFSRDESVNSKPDRVLLANSAGQQREAEITEIVFELWGVECELVRSVESFDTLKNGYHNPAQLGVDRWLGMIASWSRLQEPFILIDSGSAITIDLVCLVDGYGEHQGGVILPSLGDSWDDFACKIPHLKEMPLIERGGEGSLIGKSTVEAMRLDLAGTAESVRKVVQNILKLHKQNGGNLPRVVVTGGGSAQLLNSITLGQSIKFTTVKSLVLDGLAILCDP